MPPHSSQQRVAALATAALILVSLAIRPVFAASAADAARSAVAGGVHNGAATLNRQVFGFALASSLTDPTIGYTTWNFSLLSTVAFFGIHVNWDGSLVQDSAWTTWNSSALTGLLTTAHSNGTKVVLTVDMQDFSAGSANMCAALINRATTIQQAVAQVTAKHVDGMNIDYEGLNAPCQNGQTTRSMLVAFVQQLRAAMPAGLVLSIDTYASSSADPLGFFDVAGLNQYVDSFFVMAYDLEYSNWHYSPTSCGSFCLGPTAPIAGYHYNDSSTLAQYTAVVPALKVILGVPYYGRKACVAGTSPNAYPTGDVVADSYLDASGESTAPNVQSYVVHRDANDPQGQERWDTWYNTSLGCTRELYWDDTVSLAKKYDLVAQYGAGGVGIWTLNYGGGAPELWQLLADKFAAAWISLGGGATSRPAPAQSSSGRLDVFTKGQDNALWQRTWNGSAWSGWTSVGGSLTSSPAAVASGTNRIDVFARGVDNRLWHRWWNGSAWSSWSPVGGVLTSGPAVASWSAGRLDVFARGQDQALWHVSWSASGGWSAWQSLGGVLTSDPAAVSWGANRIDVFARGKDNALWHLWWNGSSWWGWSSLGGQLGSAPAVSSCASGRLDIVALGMNSEVYRLGYAAAWTPWESSSTQTWTSDPGASCLGGSSTFDVYDRGSDNATWYTRILSS